MSDYSNDVRIDTEQLDLEWVKQPQLYHKYLEEAIFARDARDRAKQRRDVVAAEVGKDIRANPSKYGLDKATETAITTLIPTAPAYKEAIETYSQACLEADLVQAAVSAIEMRKSALENLVRLHATSYFAGPTEPRDLTAAQREYEKSVHDDASKRSVRGMARERLNSGKKLDVEVDKPAAEERVVRRRSTT